MSLSAVIITFNEERNIGRCLDSLRGVADEIVVVDSFSSDGTRAICLEKGARFLQHAFTGHIEQKNYALEQATYPIVLSLDADEALSEALRSSVLGALDNWQHDAYAMNRLTNYCGQWIHHSGWYPDRKVRLFDKRKAHWGGTNPHDRVEMAEGSSTSWLAGDLLHYSYYTTQEHDERARKYAAIAAHAMFLQQKKGAWWRLWVSPVAKFIRNYILRLGLLDGRAGLRICYVSALETFWKYRDLRSLQNKSGPQ